jgi:hypothetical protein
MLQAGETELERVQQQQVVWLLGSLGGRLNSALVSVSGEELAHAAVAWDTTTHLPFSVPFMDCKPTIHFGESCSAAQGLWDIVFVESRNSLCQGIKFMKPGSLLLLTMCLDNCCGLFLHSVDLNKNLGPVSLKRL